MDNPIATFQRFVYAEDVSGLDKVLTALPADADLVNQPLFCFGQRAVHMAKRNLGLLDMLLTHGADINLKSEWEPGGFHILEETTPDLGAALVARGAIPDIFSYVGWDDRDSVARLLGEDPDLVHALGGDGVRPLHYAQSVSVARLLLESGADINARCVDHESTAAQYALKQRTAVLAFLVDHGADVDLFMAIALEDEARIKELLQAEPEAVHWRIGEGRYEVPTRDPKGIQGGNIYLWRLGGGLSPLEVAAQLENSAICDLLSPLASPRNRLAAAVRQGDVAGARALCAEFSGLLKEAKPPLYSLMGDLTWAGNVAAVEALLACGMDVDTRWNHQHTPLIVAALRGQAGVMALLLAHDPDLEARNEFGGTALQAVAFGSVSSAQFGTNPDGDYVACARLLVEAGASVDVAISGGSPEVLRVLGRGATE